jgi:Heterokaryon incompatibility protein (HET)
MRLLNTQTFELVEFASNSIPEQYAILSHTWSQVNGEELQFADLKDPSVWESKPGYLKVKGFCELCQAEGFEWCWVDTCCIDKSSSSELSEAINSMYKWYRESTRCFAYLADIEAKVESENDHSLGSPFSTLPEDFWRSRWVRYRDSPRDF